MTVSNTTGLSNDLLASLQSAALGQYQQSSQVSSFAQAMQQAIAGGGSNSSVSSSPVTGTSTTTNSQSDSFDTDVVAGGEELTGSFQSSSLIAVGTFGPDGKMIPFSQQQIASEYQSVADASKSAYADALQNFLTLSKGADSDGGSSGTTYTDKSSFTSDNGLVSANFDATFSLKPVGGSAQSAS